MKPNEPNNPEDRWPESLITLLEKQQGIVTTLSDLANYQGDLIETKRTEPLLGLLAQRQNLLDEFTGFQGDLGSLTENIEQRMNGVPEHQKLRIQSLIDEIGSHLSRIMQQDREDEKSLVATRDRVKQELAATGMAQHARNAYTKSNVVETRFADREG